MLRDERASSDTFANGLFRRRRTASICPKRKIVKKCRGRSREKRHLPRFRRGYCFVFASGRERPCMFCGRGFLCPRICPRKNAAVQPTRLSDMSVRGGTEKTFLRRGSFFALWYCERICSHKLCGARVRQCPHAAALNRSAAGSPRWACRRFSCRRASS